MHGWHLNDRGHAVSFHSPLRGEIRAPRFTGGHLRDHGSEKKWRGQVNRDSMHTGKTSQVIEKRKEKIEALKDKKVDLYPNDFRVSHTIHDIEHILADAAASITEESPVFVVAGRMMAINRFGKSAFIRFRDRTGQLQAYVRKDRVGEDIYAQFKQMDIGDFVGLRGGMFKTKTGEWTFYYRNQKVESQGQYAKDKKTGAWIYYSRSGTILDKVDEDSGKSLMN